MLQVNVEHRLGAFHVKAQFECGGGVSALFGRSGSGKTSLINMIAGLMKPESGSIRFNGETLFDAKRGIHVAPGARQFGYVFQEGRLFPHLNVQQNLEYALWFQKRKVQSSHQNTLIELLDLGLLLKRRVGHLSGGERQQVALGRALMAQPRLLLLDEPLAALDEPKRLEILRYLQTLRKEMKLPMIYVSHAVDEVLRLADQVVLISAGQVLASGEVEAVMGGALTGLGEKVFEGGAVIQGVVQAIDPSDGLATVTFDGGQLTLVGHNFCVADTLRVRIRAREVALSLTQPENVSIQNILQGRIERLEHQGQTHVLVSVAVGTVLIRSRITVRAMRQLQLQSGMTVFALIKAVSLDR